MVSSNHRVIICIHDAGAGAVVSVSPPVLHVRENDTITWLCNMPEFTCTFSDLPPFKRRVICGRNGTTQPAEVAVARGEYRYTWTHGAVGLGDDGLGCPHPAIVVHPATSHEN